MMLVNGMMHDENADTIKVNRASAIAAPETGS